MASNPKSRNECIISTEIKRIKFKDIISLTILVINNSTPKALIMA